MTKVDKSVVERLAKLSKLEFDEASKEAIVADLDRILGFVEKIDELDTTGVEPLIYMSEVQNVFREDQASSDLTKEQALEIAPLKDSDFIKVPKVLKKD